MIDHNNDMIQYYNKIFKPQNLVISINGNVDKDKTVKAFNKIFKENNAKTFNYNDYNSAVPYISSAKEVVQHMPSTETAWIMLGWQTGKITNKKEIATLQVIDSLLGNGMSSRLFRSMREAEGLAYQLGTSYSPKMLGGIFMGYIGTNPSTLEHSRNKMLSEIYRLKTEFVSDSELQDAKDRLKGGFILALETNSDKASNIGLFETYGFGYDFLKSYIKMIDEVTASDIVRVANKYFTQNYVQSDVR